MPPMLRIQCRPLNEGMTANVEVVVVAEAVVVGNHDVIDHWNFGLKMAEVVFCKRPYRPKTKSLVWMGE